MLNLGLDPPTKGAGYSTKGAIVQPTAAEIAAGVEADAADWNTPNHTTNDHPYHIDRTLGSSR